MRFVLAVAVALVLLTCAAESASVGYKVGTCDPLNPYMGCPYNPGYELNSEGEPDHLKCQTAGRIMPWAYEPVLSADYVMSAGANEAVPRTSYTPGEVIDIRIRTRNRLKKIRGILMTAEQVSSGTARTQVGSWELIPDDPRTFTHPVLAGCDNALIHTSASLKLSNLIAKWRAPVVGTGSVAFKVLLKYGNANDGYFYRPAQELVLTEGTPSSTQPAGSRTAWIRGDIGQSCDTVCASATPFGTTAGTWSCEASKFESASIGAMQPILSQHKCLLPYLSLCSTTGVGPTSSNDGLCYYHDSALCALEGRQTSPATCGASSSDLEIGSRFCPCTDSATCVPLTTCPDANSQCGSIPDGCGGTVSCGGCALSHQTCTNNLCTCTPHLCSDHGWTCAVHDDGCGSTVDCKTCPTGERCANNATCSSVPVTCTPLAACPNPVTQCGNVDDGCGGFVGCGGCPSIHDTCRNNICSCSPHNCSEHGWQCGVHDDGCGGTVDCGGCGASETCHNSTHCIPDACVPAENCAMVDACGLLSTVCTNDNSTIDFQCGSCRDPFVCDSLTNLCKCIPRSAADACLGTCGSADDGCGTTITCAPCDCTNQCKCVPAQACPSVGACGILSTTCTNDGSSIELFCGNCSAGLACDSTINQCRCVPARTCPSAGACGNLATTCMNDGSSIIVSCGTCSTPFECDSATNLCVSGTCGVGEIWRAGACLCDEGQGYELSSSGLCEKKETDEASPASHKLSSFTLLVFFGASAGFATRQSLFAMLLFSIIVGVSNGVEAHNWINSLSRSEEASTVKPHQQGTVMPHVQVAAGQKFQIEWMAAHASSDLSYFVTVAYKDQEILTRLSATELDEYLDGCPTDAYATASDPVWSKYHRKGINGDNTNNNKWTPELQAKPNFFQEVVTPQMSNYYPRPVQFRGWIRNEGVIDEPTGIRQRPGYPALANGDSDNANIHQLRYKATELDKDRRCTYTNSKYPEIISVAAFDHNCGQFIRPDFAQFEIPAGSPRGRYVINWQWQGYYDSVDVDVIANTVPLDLMYGVPQTTGESLWYKFEHAQFEEPQWVFGGCMGVVDNIERCKYRCGVNCDGVNVVPVHPPEGMYAGFDDPSDPRIPWYTSTGQGNHTNCPREAFANAPRGSYLCYPVDARRDTGANTVGQLTITDDPDDPVFYSFAFRKHEGLVFDLSSSIVPQQFISWRYGDSCVSCKDAAQRASDYYPYEYLNPSSDPPCRNCDVEPFTGQLQTGPRPATWSKLVTNSVCDGYKGVWRDAAHTTCPVGTACTKNLVDAMGWYRDWWRNVSAGECMELVRRDPECDQKIVMYGDQTWSHDVCHCYLKTPCCQGCSRVHDTDWQTALWEFTPSAADPTCATGVRSGDNVKCCPATCSSCANKWDATTASLGVCGGVTDPGRLCTSFGPPCLL